MDKGPGRPPFGALDAAKIWLIRRSWTIRRRLNIEVRTKIGGREFVIPVRGGIGLGLVLDDPAEAELRETLGRVLRFRPGPVVDVGANVGVFLKCLVAEDPDIPYIGFEPDIACAEHLMRLIRVNSLCRHTVLPVGLGSGREVLALWSNGEADVSATVVTGARPASMYACSTRILVETGDAVLEGYFENERISLIKIDVEDAEPMVVAGLTHIIEQHRPFIILEVCPYQHFLDGHIRESYYGSASRDEMTAIATRRRELIRELDDSLGKRRYRAMKVHSDGSLSPVDSVDPGNSRNFTELNYLAVPAEEYDAFLQSV
jgi:FkbM family methyltransferase